MDIRLLGPVEVWVAGRRVEVGPPQRCAVLAVLAAEAPQPVPIEILIDRVWGEAVPARVQSGIHAHITSLRRVLAEAAALNQQPPARLVHNGAAYVLAVDPQRVDLHRFRRMATAAKNCADGERAELLQQALELWRGQALATLSGAWTARMRETWALEKLDAAVDWARTELRLGRQEQVISPVRALLTAYPLAEPLAAVLMRALATTGRAAEALECFTIMQKQLIEQLGVDPGSELQALHQEILRGDLDDSPPVPIAAAPAHRTPALLPSEPRGFTGRTDQLGALDALADTITSCPATVVISAIAGTAGVGKTALALHWAHRRRQQFPDGQLYVNLRGFNPDREVMAPATAIRLFLDALDVPPRRIPVELDAQVNLYRTLMADRRMLVVLDNARDADQVRPLLPGAPRCLVLITSRNQLASLVAAEGAHHLALDLLTGDEARKLLIQRLGIARVSAEPGAVAEIIVACARLPLALSIVAARAAIAKDQPLAVLADELRTSRNRLDSLSADDDPYTDVRSVLSWSYRALTPDAARLFRLLGLHPGPDITVAATASLAALPLPEARAQLAELTRANLLAEHTAGRYTSHDLLRAYATGLAHTTDTDQQRHAATHRVLDHYLHTAATAEGLLHPARDPITLTTVEPGTIPENPIDREQALSWFAAEHAVLLAALDNAAATGFDSHIWRLAWTLNTFLSRRGHWQDDLAAQHAAVAAAKRRADPLEQARAYRIAGGAAIRLGRYDDAHAHLRHALDLTIQADDRVGQAHTHIGLSLMCERQNRFAEALAHDRKALDLYRAASHRYGEAHALNSVGWHYAELSDYQQALTYSQQALALNSELGDRNGQAASWDSLGYAHHRIGHQAEAITCYQHALGLTRDVGNRFYEAETLSHLGDAHHATGDHDNARNAWQQALTILDQLDHPNAGHLRSKLADLDAH
jgi:DNA-binding SARP family transcriptional activator/tetratricopeptide (TPR) repeat protein